MLAELVFHFAGVKAFKRVSNRSMSLTRVSICHMIDRIISGYILYFTLDRDIRTTSIDINRRNHRAWNLVLMHELFFSHSLRDFTISSRVYAHSTIYSIPFRTWLHLNCYFYAFFARGMIRTSTIIDLLGQLKICVKECWMSGTVTGLILYRLVGRIIRLYDKIKSGHQGFFSFIRI